MKAFFKNLKLRGKSLALIITIGALLLSALMMGIASVVIALTNKKESPELETGAGIVSSFDYTFWSSDETLGYKATDDVDGISIEDKKKAYNASRTFGIRTVAGLNAFSQSVANGYTFFGKKVYLYFDTPSIYSNSFVPVGVDMYEGYSSSSLKKTTQYKGCKLFNGEFDGQGFTIDFSKYNSEITVESLAANQQQMYLGVFGHIGESSKIKNLRINGLTISNFDIKNTSGFVRWHIGAIAGKAEGGAKIENCSVEYFDIYSNDAATYVSSFIGCENSLSGGFNVSINNCYVEDFYVNGDEQPQNAHLYKAPFDEDSKSTSTSTEVKSCVFPYIEDFGWTETWHEAAWNTRSYGDANNAIYTSPNKYNKLNISSIGGQMYSAPWYYVGDEYNSGYPCLRRFVFDWSSISFQPNDSGLGSICHADRCNVKGDDDLAFSEYPSGVEIFVPSSDLADFEAGFRKAFSGSTERFITIYNQTFWAKPKKGCGFVNWSRDFDTFYWANFEELPINITFIGGDKINLYDELSANNGNAITLTYTVMSGTSVSMTRTLSGSSKNCREVKYSFTDYYGVDHLIVFKLTDKAYFLEAPERFWEFDVEHSEIIVNAILKTYIPTWK